MALKTVNNLRFITTDFSYKDKYWPKVSSFVQENYGVEEIDNPSTVEEILKACFQLFIDEFRVLIKQQEKASFYLFVHDLHEDSIKLWQKQLRKESIDPVNEDDLAVERRVYKLVLEQACEFDLIGTNNFLKEVHEKYNQYKIALEELLYVGYWIYGFCDFVTQCQIIHKSTGIKIDENGVLNILTYSPYKELLEFVRNDMPQHFHKVVIQNNLPDLIQCINEEMGINYGECLSIANRQEENHIFRYGLSKMEQIIQEISHDRGYNQEDLKKFYDGLTLNRENKLTIEDTILRSQKTNRYVYKPIIQLKIDDEEYHLMGYEKIHESIITLTTNAIPFNHCSEEWMTYPGISRFVNDLSNSHDSILEHPAQELLQNYGFLHDSNISSLKQSSGNNVPIVVRGVGEIDIIFIDTTYQLLYICECKHNRSRFDMLNWRRDLSNFRKRYETQLTNKVEWVKQNLQIVSEHFQSISGDKNLDLTKYESRGIFIINAPTFYMYDGKFRVFTLHSFEQLLKRDFVNVIFRFNNEDTGKVFQIAYPYLTNLRNVLND
jgi:hypothetical protein